MYQLDTSAAAKKKQKNSEKQAASEAGVFPIDLLLFLVTSN